MKSFAFLALPALALANPILTEHAQLYERATPTVPQQIPTGSVCQGATSTATTNVQAAVAGSYSNVSIFAIQG